MPHLVVVRGTSYGGSACWPVRYGRVAASRCLGNVFRGHWPVESRANTECIKAGEFFFCFFFSFSRSNSLDFDPPSRRLDACTFLSTDLIVCFCNPLAAFVQLRRRLRSR